MSEWVYQWPMFSTINNEIVGVGKIEKSKIRLKRVLLFTAGDKSSLRDHHSESVIQLSLEIYLDIYLSCISV